MKMKMRLRLNENFSIICILVLLGGPGSAVLVQPNDSIQSAIDSADQGEVSSGDYHESLKITKSLILKGFDSGKGAPLIDADDGAALTNISGWSHTTWIPSQVFEWPEKR